MTVCMCMCVCSTMYCIWCVVCVCVCVLLQIGFVTLTIVFLTKITIVNMFYGMILTITANYKQYSAQSSYRNN